MRTVICVLALMLVVGTAYADDADAQYKQGLAFKQQGKVDDAITAFEKAVASNPKHGMAWASLGHLYKQKGADTSKIVGARSEEHTSELQSRLHLVCRLLLEKKK